MHHKEEHHDTSPCWWEDDRRRQSCSVRPDATVASSIMSRRHHANPDSTRHTGRKKNGTVSSCSIILLGMWWCLAAIVQAATVAKDATVTNTIHMGVPQHTDAGSDSDISDERIQEALQDRKDYFVSNVLNVLSPQQIERCRDLEERCLLWSLQDECSHNEDFMDQHCALSCHVCDKVLPDEERCFHVESGPDAWQPGDLDRMFRRIVEDPWYQQNYKVQVLSSPDSENSSSGTASDNDEDEDVSSETPWVIVLDDFLTAKEAERLIELGALEGYDTSTLAERDDEDDDRWRTSSNSWCQQKCHGDEVYESVMERMVEMTKIPRDYAEDMQMLRYLPGQFYKAHHDYIENDDMSQRGCRILTVFLYLNDVEEGGSTAFPDLNLTVTPKTGRALIWPSVLNEDPRAINWGTEHEAQVVTKGQKFGANVWFHSKPLQLAWTKFECCKKQKTFVENGPLLWGEGDLDAMFHRIAKDPELAEAYHTKVLSSPKRNGPWVIALQNFLTPDEAATLVELGAEHGYENSTVGMDANQDDSTQSSMQVFCEGECEENEVVQLVLDRIYELTQIPEEYSEQMQLLKYEMGQFYNKHHDFFEDMDEETDLQTGNRILSVYMYLNDVEEGGETIFPELDLVVSPEVGKVIIWPNVLNDKPTEMDGRTIYEAKPVIAGSKYGANVWFRYRPIRSAWREPICNDNDEDDQSHTEELDALKTEL